MSALVTLTTLAFLIIRSHNTVSTLVHFLGPVDSKHARFIAEQFADELRGEAAGHRAWQFPGWLGAIRQRLSDPRDVLYRSRRHDTPATGFPVRPSGHRDERSGCVQNQRKAMTLPMS